MPRPARLPKRLPTGTRYVVEGRAAGNGQFRVSARYLVYPDGRRVDVPGETVLPISCCAKCAEEGKRAHATRTRRRPRPPARRSGDDVGLRLGA
jgi:hypothetical protein